MDSDTKLSAYDSGCDGLDCVIGRDDTSGCSSFTTEVKWGTDGTEELILVHGFGTATVNFDLTVTCTQRIDEHRSS